MIHCMVYSMSWITCGSAVQRRERLRAMMIMIMIDRRKGLDGVVGGDKCRIITHNITNFRGFKANTPVGSKMKQVTNNAAAARLRPPNMSILSHRLTRG